jgi:hypothetical protein
MSQPHKNRPSTIFFAILLGAAGAWMAAAGAKPDAPAEKTEKAAASSGQAECVAVPVPFVHNPSNIKAGGRGGQQLPEGWKPAGGSVLDGRPIVIACR